ncbi:hypothetical protein HPP92_026534 [Vanilla planifolia]|uniref:alpha-1,2-Mannosidase n=1 Tax=Vanilla planifolia TaxID=51239 RepID=A0A835PES3_VANPL|nr:hypothetical protein HPP92_026534 [Vanilla planifolia]
MDMSALLVKLCVKVEGPRYKFPDTPETDLTTVPLSFGIVVFFLQLEVCLRMIVATRIFSTNGICYDYGRCSIGKFLMLLMIGGLTYLMIVHRSSNHLASTVALQNTTTWDIRDVKKHKIIGRLWKKPPRLPPQLSPDDIKNTSLLEWISRQKKVKEAFVHAWTGYRRYAMGYDELMPLSKRGIDGLGGLGATIVDSLDTAMIMGLDEIVYEQGVWIEKNLMERIRTKGQVNLFETTTRVLGGLLSAYHLSGNERGAMNTSGVYVNLKGLNRDVFLETAKNLANHLLFAFTSSPTAIPFSDVVLKEKTLLILLQMA